MRVVRVLAAIHFDDQASLGTKKIGKVSADRRLTTKFPALKSPATEMRPQRTLSFSWLCAQLAGAAHGVRMLRQLPLPCPLPQGEGKKSRSRVEHPALPLIALRAGAQAQTIETSEALGVFLVVRARIVFERRDACI